MGIHPEGTAAKSDGPEDEYPQSVVLKIARLESSLAMVFRTFSSHAYEERSYQVRMFGAVSLAISPTLVIADTTSISSALPLSSNFTLSRASLKSPD